MLADETVEQLMAFRREREWEQFHTPKNLAIAISVEAAELLEQFQWSSDDASVDATEAIRHEMADVAILLTYLAKDLGVDLDSAVRAKLVLNAAKYPVERNRGVVRASASPRPSLTRD